MQVNSFRHFVIPSMFIKNWKNANNFVKKSLNNKKSNVNRTRARWSISLNRCRRKTETTHHRIFTIDRWRNRVCLIKKFRKRERKNELLTSRRKKFIRLRLCSIRRTMGRQNTTTNNTCTPTSRRSISR